MKAIVVIPSQGFANRMRMIASSYILAEYMKLEHYICWNPHNDCNIKFDEIWESHPFKTIEFNTFSTSKYLYCGYVHTMHVMDQILNPGNVKYIILTGGHEFKHPAMNDSEFLHHKYKLYSQLQFKIPQTSQLTLPHIYGSIHIRTITAKDEKDVKNSYQCNFPQNSPIEEYLRILKLVDDDVPLCVISNDPAMYFIFAKKFPTKKIFSSKPESFDRDSSDGMCNAIKDFVILSRSSFIIGSYYSSFSDEASFVNTIPKIIPLSNHLCDAQIKYHCTNYKIVNKTGFLNYDQNVIIKFFKGLHI